MVQHSQSLNQGSTNALGQMEYLEKQSKRARKKARKVQDGTDGIDATDEYQDNPDRLRDGWAYMNPDD